MAVTTKRFRPPFVVNPKNRSWNSIVPQGHAMNVREALYKLTSGTLDERLGYYYDDLYGFTGETAPPDFNMMTRLEKMQALADKRDEVQAYIDKYGELVTPKDNIPEDLSSPGTDR